MDNEFENGGTPDFPTPPPGIMRTNIDSRWQRFAIADIDNNYWDGKTWTARLAEAVLYSSEAAAIAERDRHCFYGDTEGETWTAMITLTVRADEWRREELVAYLRRRGKFLLQQVSNGKTVWIEVMGEGLAKVDRHVEKTDGTGE